MRLGVCTTIVLLVGGLTVLLSGCGNTPLAEEMVPAVVQPENPAPVAAGESSQSNPSGPAKAPSGESPPNPGDPGGRLLAQRLAPNQVPSTGEESASKRRLPEMKIQDHPAAALLPFESPGPRLSLRSGQPSLRPGPFPEDTPLVDFRNPPQPPPGLDLPAGERIRVPSPDVNQPVPLPPLALQVVERPGQEDPTAEYSQAAVRATPPPVRTTPAPFQRLTLPDPFEHRQNVRLANPPAEDAKPVTASPRPPGK